MSASFIDLTKFSPAEFEHMAAMSQKDREATISKAVSRDYTKDDVCSIAPMTFFEEATAIVVFLFGVPGAVFSLPVVVLIAGYLLQSYRLVISISLAIAVILAIWPAPFIEKSLSSWIAVQVLRYFSFKGIFEEPLSSEKPYILVAPPHGVFPFGNIATMIAFPSIMGFSFRALAASAALRMPVFRQLLGTIGATDAARSNAERLLNKNITIGISTGGVAEIFETSRDGDEVIVLKSRQGLVRLAFRTGAALVPCYLLGNTHLLSLWCGGNEDSFIRRNLQWVSRKLGVALILFWGRMFLPIPYRVPIIGLMAKPIEVPKKEHPTNEEIEFYHNKLMEEMVNLFDRHKAKYGWENKKLIIR